MSTKENTNSKSTTNKYDVEIAAIHFKSERYIKTCKYILTLLMVGIVCYTLLQVMSFPAENIHALAAVVGGDKKLLVGSVIFNISLSVAWVITFNDNRSLRRGRI